jgi:effector-binding domain-containing protein
MESQLAQTQSTVASRRALLEHPDAPVTVTYRSMPRTRSLAIIETVGLAEAVEWLLAALGEIDQVLADADLPSARVRGCLFPGEYFELEEAELVAFAPIGARVQGTGRATIFEVPAAELAVAVYQGSFDNIDATYGALGKYVAERAIGVEGPMREYYPVSPFDTDDESRFRAEVCWPIFQTAPG